MAALTKECWLPCSHRPPGGSIGLFSPLSFLATVAWTASGHLTRGLPQVSWAIRSLRNLNWEMLGEEPAPSDVGHSEGSSSGSPVGLYIPRAPP